ncbi:hypothetical protein PYCCODRAFT_1480083 [Trametes coccinea BRFM310]|uniref:Uncharacterized protein n=1 Tax=Trametes coccinea (strain BRFM310) TaxID=1353009 RepID=A0A1Y2IDM6_TRAC3|nr:hypothetical protein PYCCODRAFT_1480083 [Trametes coccinea BRFM310]
MSAGFPRLKPVKKSLKIIRPATLDSPSSSSPSPPSTQKNAKKASKPENKKTNKKRQARELSSEDQEDGLTPNSPEPDKNSVHTSTKRQRLDVAAHDPHVIAAYRALDHRAQFITRAANNYEHLYEAARLLPRLVGPFVNYDRVLTAGLLREGTYTAEDPEQAEKIFNDYYEVLCYFSTICDHFPGFRKHTDYLRQHHDLVIRIAQFMHTVAGKARGDDANRVKSHIYRVAQWHKIDAKLAHKNERGFKHLHTGRLLCPVTLLDEFDADPEWFCRAVRDLHDDRPWVTGDDWPLFLYDMDEYNPNDFKAGFLKGPLVLLCFKVVFTGPGSAMPSEERGATKAKGKPPVIRNFDDPADSITFFAIVYVACLTRFVLNSQLEWSDDDGDFKGLEFVRSILTIALRNPAWKDTVVEWYTRRVLDEPRGKGPPRNRRTTYSVLLSAEQGPQGSRSPTSEPAEDNKDNHQSDEDDADGEPEARRGEEASENAA